MDVSQSHRTKQQILHDLHDAVHYDALASTKEVVHEEMQDDGAYGEIGECSVNDLTTVTIVNTTTHLSGDTSLNSPRLSGLTCARKDAVRTNWPTVLPKLGRR